MPSLLVIGGSGFFGKSILDSFARGLLNRWSIDEVLVLSRNATRLHLETPELISTKVTLINADISTCSKLPFADYVVHAAASADAKKYLMYSDIEKDNILRSTKNYCDLAQKFHRKSKILYVSSGAVYGVQKSDVMEISEECSLALSLEDMPLNKIGYAAAKRDSEEMIKALGFMGIDVSIARCFAFIGKYLPLDQHFAVGNFIGDGLRGQEIRVNARKKVFRSYLYADDLVDWLMSITSLSSIHCPTFNVGSNETVRIDELAEMIAKKCNTRAVGYEQASEEVDRYIPDIKKACLHGMAVNWNLEDALEITIRQLRRDNIGKNA